MSDTDQASELPNNSTSEASAKNGSDVVRLQILINPEKTLATLNASPGLGQTLTSKDLSFALREAGILLPPDPKAVGDLYKAVERNVPIRNLVIAKSVPAIPGKSARIERYGDWTKPVFPGDVFGKLTPAVKPQLGRLLDGTPMDPPGIENFKEIRVLETDFVTLNPDGSLKAEKCGYPQVTNDCISILPLLKVTTDYMEVRATIHATDFKGKLIDSDMMRAAFQAEKIVESCDGNAFSRALAEIQETRKPKPDVVICKGIPPRPGKDGWFDMYVEDERSDVGLKTVDDRIDFRARGVVRSIKPEERIGRILPPEEGRPGRDVYGRIIPAPHGKIFHLQTQENVKSDDGEEFYATSAGMVFFVGNTLSVTDVFTTKGDVDMTSGNIEVETGSVHVRGAILSGFKVKSPRNVVVEDVIEGTVEAGGDIEVRGGIIMDKLGRIGAGGGVSALYAKNATICAEGDVNIAHEITNCDIYAGQRILAVKGRGKIIGGTLRSGAGIFANEVGSELGVETVIHLGLERRADDSSMKRIKELKDLLQKIYASLGSDSPKAILERTKPEKRKTVAELLRSRLAAEEELKKLQAIVNHEREEMRQASQAALKVKGSIHAGVVIHCFGSTVKLTKAVDNSRIYYDPALRKIVIGS